jgi:hypothetical protein
MGFGGLVVRPTLAQLIERGDRFLRMPKAELGPRFAERKHGVVAHRQHQNVLVVVQRLAEFSKREAFLGEGASVGDGVGDVELIGECPVALLRIERADNPPARVLALRAAEPFGQQLDDDIRERAETRQKQDYVAPGPNRPVFAAWTMKTTLTASKMMPKGIATPECGERSAHAACLK